MKNIRAISFVRHLLLSTPVCTQDRCESHDFAGPSHGRYCPTEGIFIPNLSWRQYKLFCLHASSCKAVSYDFNDNVCIYLTVTCIKAISHPDMAFAVFTGRQTHQCVDWIPIVGSLNPSTVRTITSGNRRFVARMQKDGNDFACYLIANWNLNCVTRDDGGSFSTVHGYPCQYMLLRDGCTVYYMNYELDTPLPANALIAGHTTSGLPVYIGIEEGATRSGYYIPGSKRLILPDGNVTENVKILVLL